MNPLTMAKIAADMLRGNRNDPRWNSQGQPMPPQAMLDQPVPGAMPGQGQGIEDASGLGGRVGGVAAELARREQERRRLLQGL